MKIKCIETGSTELAHNVQVRNIYKNSDSSYVLERKNDFREYINEIFAGLIWLA